MLVHGPSLKGVAALGKGVPAWKIGTAPFLEIDIASGVYTYRGQTYANFDALWAAVSGSYTRSGTKRYINSSKQLVTAGANVWPTEYDEQTGALIGKTIHPAVTARGTNRRDLTNAAWVKNSGTAAKDQTGIDGAPNAASSFIATSVNATCLQSVTDANSRSRCVVVFLKRLAGTGAIELTMDGGTTWVAVTSSVVSGDWTQVIINQAAVTSPTFGIRLATSGDKIAWDFGRVVDGYKPGPVLDDGESNSADVATITLSNLPDFHFSQGTVSVRYRSLVSSILSGAGGEILSVNADSNNVLCHIDQQANGGVLAEEIYANSFDGSCSPGTGYPPATSTFDDRFSSWAAVRYKADDYALSVDGWVGATDSNTSGRVPAPTRIQFGAGRGGTYSVAISGLRLYRSGLYGAQLASASASPRPIMVRGDSLASGSNASARRFEWGHKLAQAMSPERTYGDGGVGGTTSTQCLATVTADTNRRSFRHIIWSGHNDGALTPAETMANLMAIEALVGATAIFGTVLVGPSDDGTTIARKNTLNALIKAQWPTRSIDFNQAVIDGGGAALFSDTIHLNDAGETVASTAAKAVTDALGA